MLTNKGYIFLISAPSGCGKTTITRNVIESLQKENIAISRMVTYTTRSPRVGEIDGIDYFFITKEAFLIYKQQGFFLETTYYNDHYYGSPQSIIDAAAHGQSTIIITDLNGFASFKHVIPNIITIWLTVPTIAILKERLIQRGSENKLAIKKRLIIAEQELALAQHKHFDYVIMNISRSKTVKKIQRLIKKRLKLDI